MICLRVGLNIKNREWKGGCGPIPISQHITTTCVSSWKKWCTLKLFIKFLYIFSKSSTLGIGYCTPEVENKIICETKVFEFRVVHCHCEITWVVCLAPHLPYWLSCDQIEIHVIKNFSVYLDFVPDPFLSW